MDFRLRYLNFGGAFSFTRLPWLWHLIDWDLGWWLLVLDLLPDYTLLLSSLLRCRFLETILGLRNFSGVRRSFLRGAKFEFSVLCMGGFFEPGFLVVLVLAPGIVCFFEFEGIINRSLGLWRFFFKITYTCFSYSSTLSISLSRKLICSNFCCIFEEIFRFSSYF